MSALALIGLIVGGALYAVAVAVIVYVVVITGVMACG